ncbi:dipeptide/oligopeptide/nickel ABC transporter ATP-binding protein [Luteimicrobium album]|uniref:Dipeptide/oligopeptide/nickel ABC transporter ATP-binding protein n=1 Tax=Luteimicrobium album TaxID=1054550 RepID=A0ABQ6I005_9MICO|nr:ABC transporter ATP-binding protein [Luteimicrobium album]GMA23508.1 dipeptide/oligopeptide/nickel ABC transporter ATP-binding protein [Luteimicrobium album]
MTTLEVRHLTKDYRSHRGHGAALRAVDDFSVRVTAGETVALVGESGSGKSTVAKMAVRLVTPTAGEVLLDGVAPARGGRADKRYRSRVQMVFQDPFSSLNPSLPIAYQLARPLRIHGVVRSAAEEERELLRLMEAVNLSPAKEVLRKYPHELSGGQRQRVAIARALAPRPEVLIADEPVSMLDVSIRLEILQLLDDLKRENDLAVLYITHDLATARHFSSRIVVMRRGRVVERGRSDDVILTPVHPYTQLLVRAAPDPASGPFAVDLQRYERHPEVTLGALDPDLDTWPEDAHWARDWRDDDADRSLVEELTGLAAASR